MKRIAILISVLIAAMLGTYACGGSSNNSNSNYNRNVNSGSTAGNAMNSIENTANRAANSVANAVTSLTTTSPDSFMKDAAEGGMAEVQMGQLAEKNSTNPEVKKFGAMMVTDHGAANKELEAIAKKKNFALPTDIGSHKSEYDKLNGLKGADFDKEYVSEMVSDHESDLSAFQKQADNSSDPEVKAFAAKTATVIKKHLDAIKAIQAKMK